MERSERGGAAAGPLKGTGHKSCSSSGTLSSDTIISLERREVGKFSSLMDFSLQFGPENQTSDSINPLLSDRSC